MKKKGFTLIELMIVVAIIGILLAMLLPRVGLLIDRSRERATAKNLKNIYSAIFDTSQREFGRMDWPDDADEVVAELTTGSPRYFTSIPRALLRRAIEGHSDDQLNSNAIIDGGNDARDVEDPHGGWIYVDEVGSATQTRGEIYINCNDDDTFGVPYNRYECN